MQSPTLAFLVFCDVESTVPPTVSEVVGIEYVFPLFASLTADTNTNCYQIQDNNPPGLFGGRNDRAAAIAEYRLRPVIVLGRP